MCNMGTLSQSVQNLMPRLRILWTDRNTPEQMPIMPI